MSTTNYSKDKIEKVAVGIGANQPPYGYGGRSGAMETEQTFKLNEKQEQEFERTLKAGVFRGLHKQGLLTDGQVAKLLERLMKGGATQC